MHSFTNALHTNLIYLTPTLHSQGWSSYPSDSGKHNSHTWGEARVNAKYTTYRGVSPVEGEGTADTGDKGGDPKGDSDMNSVQRPLYRVYRNFHAGEDWVKHEYCFDSSTAFLRQINNLLQVGI